MKLETYKESTEELAQDYILRAEAVIEKLPTTLKYKIPDKYSDYEK